MGTDIHGICEVRTENSWNTVLDKVFPSVFDEGGFTTHFYDARNYNLFAILAGVRNGVGFAGCRTGEPFVPISNQKGYPSDICEISMEFMSEEHSASYLSLTELEKYDWTRLHRNYGIISEDVYKNTIMKGGEPESWCGEIVGPDIKIVSETEMVDIIFNIKKRDIGKRYYTGVYMYPKTYADTVDHFYYKTIPVLKSLVPVNGTSDDVRIVFDFDS